MNIGIIGAMDDEVRLIKEAMTHVETATKAQMTFCKGKIGDADAIVVKSGVGKVNAAMCAQILIDDFHATQVINTGVAGSLDARIDIGDFVLSTDAVQHDVNATLFGYAVGEIPQLGRLAFTADATLKEALQSAVQEAAPDVRCFLGRVASGDQFIADKTVKERIRKDFQALCCEMEGAAIAHVCCLNDVPFCVVRAISDKADGSDIVDYPVFEKKAAFDSAAIVIHTLQSLSDTGKGGTP